MVSYNVSSSAFLASTVSGPVISKHKLLAVTSSLQAKYSESWTFFSSRYNPRVEICFKVTMSEFYISDRVITRYQYLPSVLHGQHSKLQILCLVFCTCLTPGSILQGYSQIRCPYCIKHIVLFYFATPLANPAEQPYFGLVPVNVCWFIWQQDE